MELVSLKESNKYLYNWQAKLFNSMTLKILALISMIVDHVGFMLFPEIIALRIIGRIALPIYTFLVAFGFEKTRDSSSYFLKFILMFICLQVPTTWFLYLQEKPQMSPFYMNIFANLTLGAGFIVLAQKNKILSMIYFIFILTFLVFIQKYNIAIVTEAFEQRFSIDYGIFGFLLIPTFWIVRKVINFYYKEKKYQNFLINIVSAVFLIIFLLLQYFCFWKIDPTFSSRPLNIEIQLWALVDILFILLFTEYRFDIQSVYLATTIKYFFWLSYPLTIGVTALIATMIAS